MVRSLVFLALLNGLWAAGGPRIIIVTDMEGVGGVMSFEEQNLPGQRRYEESRALLTGEVNAAIDGAFDAGAAKVVVWDGHDGSRSLSLATLHPRAELIQGSSTPADYYMGEEHYDGVMIVGQHAMAGTKDGLLAHTQNHVTISGVFLNERRVGEIGQVLAIAGHFGIPGIFLAGDRAACREFLELQPKAETAAVKWMVGRASAHSLPHQEAKRLIREGARRAVARIGEFQPWRISGPVQLRFEYYPKDGKPVPPRLYKGANVLAAYQDWLGPKR